MINEINVISEANIVNSVSRALDILEALSQAENGLRLTVLGQRLDLPPSTVHRLLNTLQSKGYVEQDETTGLYSLSTRILRLQASVNKRLHLVERAIPFLNRLAQDADISAHLAVLSELDVVYLETRSMGLYLPYFAPPGRMAPAYCTALGKVLLAHLPADELRARVQRMELRQWTANTLAQAETLLAQLESIRQQGYALDRGEFNLENRCVAAPIRNQHNQVIAAISVGGRSIAQDEAWMQAYIPIVVTNAQEISRQLGWHAS